MNLKEAYAAIDAVAKPSQAVFIRISCDWFDQPDAPRRLRIEFQVSLVPGFVSGCDQWTSYGSLESAVNECLAAYQKSLEEPAIIEDAEHVALEAENLAFEQIDDVSPNDVRSDLIVNVS